MPQFDPQLIQVMRNALEEVMIRAIYSRMARADFSRSVLAGRPNKFAVMSISDVEWSDLGVPERVIALRARGIKVERPIAVPRSSADNMAANDSAGYSAIRAENLTKHVA